MRRFLVLIAMAGCGPSGDGHATGDDVEQIDAPPGPSGLTETPLTCTDFTRTVTHSDGSRTVTNYRNAVVDGVSATDNYVIVRCYAASADPLSVNACPSGSTCSGALYPPGDVCFTDRSAKTIAGKLVAECGYSQQNFNAAGAMTSSITSYAATVKLYR